MGEAADGLLYLNDAAIRQCGLTAEDITRAIEAAFLAKHQGDAVTGAPFRFQVDADLDFKAKGGAVDGFAAVKWYGYAKSNSARGLPSFLSMLLVNRLPTGEPVALLDGHWLSGVRTAALSAAAASVLAPPQADTVGFIAAGLQARAHFDALLARFPLQRISAYSHSGRSAQTLADHARAHGVAARVVTDPREAVEDHAIVVTSTPRQAAQTGFLDPAWLPPGGFAAAPDSGRSWDPARLHLFDVLVADDLDPATGRPLEAVSHPGPFSGQLSDVLAHAPATQAPPSTRRALLFAGSGLADAAIAGLVYRTALAKGLGQHLPA